MGVRRLRVWRNLSIAFGSVVGVPLLYALTAGPLGAFGQWCYFRGYGRPEMWLWLAQAYQPLDWIVRNGPDWLADPLRAYLNWWI